MLVLSRTLHEEIVIGEGDDAIVICVTEIRGNKVKLGVSAPAGVSIHRREVYDEIQRGKSRDQNQG